MSALEKVNVSKIKANLLHPALTSHFLVEIPFPNYGKSKGGFGQYLSDNGVKYDGEKLRLLCSEATLPGSSIATHENNTDFTGVTEKFAYRRVYDDRIDLTFYVDAVNYLPIRFLNPGLSILLEKVLHQVLVDFHHFIQIIFIVLNIQCIILLRRDLELLNLKELPKVKQVLITRVIL